MYAEALRMKTGMPLPKEWSMPAYQRYIAEQLKILEGKSLDLLRNDDL